MIKDRRIAFAIYVVAFVVVWNMVDLLVRTITGNHAGDVDIVVPLIVAMVTGYLFYMAKTVNINDELEEARAADGAVILDVRGADEYARGHIPGAVNLPVDKIRAIESIAAGKDTPIFTYCQRGPRSKRAAKALRAMGYTRVINMGGINKYKGELER